MDEARAGQEKINGPRQNSFRRAIFSTDHKDIGKKYYGLALAAVTVGMFLSWIMRLHLAWPAMSIPSLQFLSHLSSYFGAPKGVPTPDYYLSLMTLHGTLMVFFVLTNAPLSGFGYYFLPIQIGARRMAFPRMGALSFWLTFLSFLILISAFFFPDGGSTSGWTAYPPLSAVGKEAGQGLGSGQTLWLMSIAVFCVTQVMNAVNFIATTLDYRTRGMTFLRMPLTAWSWLITSCIALPAFSVLLPSCVLLLLDRLAGTSFFVPAGLQIGDRLQAHAGGTPLVWQHLFWFFGHPEVYIAILPGMGIVSHVLIVSIRRPLLSAKAVIYSMAAIGVLGFVVWGHHMFVSGMNPFSSMLFSAMTLAITIPSAVIVLIWIGSLYGARIRLTTACLFCLGFISTFISGGVTGFFLAQPSVDSYLHGTYFVVGHFHLVMGVAAIFAIFAGTYFWFPKATGRAMNEKLGKAHFWLTFAGAYCTFIPFYFLGLEGNVRRYSSFVNDYMGPLMPLHKFITVAALLTGAAQFLFFYNLIYSRFHGAAAGRNPWEGTSLEWSVASPPAVGNFAEKLPIVCRDPYQIGMTALKSDFAMQDGSDGE